MRKPKIYKVMFSENQISSVTQIDRPQFLFNGKVSVSSTRFHLLFAFIKEHSLTKAVKEAEKIIHSFLGKNDDNEQFAM